MTTSEFEYSRLLTEDQKQQGIIYTGKLGFLISEMKT